jgi:hypothetical protein
MVRRGGSQGRVADSRTLRRSLTAGPDGGLIDLLRSVA